MLSNEWVWSGSWTCKSLPLNMNLKLVMRMHVHALTQRSMLIKHSNVLIEQHSWSLKAFAALSMNWNFCRSNSFCHWIRAIECMCITHFYLWVMQDCLSHNYYVHLHFRRVRVMSGTVCLLHSSDFVFLKADTNAEGSQLDTSLMSICNQQQLKCSS